MKLKEIGQKSVGRLEGLKVGVLKRKRLTVQSQKMKAMKKRGESGEGYFCGGGVENSGFMIP